MNEEAVMIGLFAIVMSCVIIVLAGPILITEQFDATITVTDKQIGDSPDYFKIIDNEYKFSAPGYLWDDVQIGHSYKVSGKCHWPSYHCSVKTIEEIVEGEI